MPQTKKAKTTAKKIKKSSSEKERTEPTVKTTTATEEKMYVNIKEFEPEITVKTTTLKIVVAIFAVVLISSWIIILRYNITNQSKNLNFSLLKEEINKNLIRFDTEIKDRKNNEAIIIDDIDNLKEKLENSNPNNSLWPTRNFEKWNLTIQYPENWIKTETEEQLTIVEEDSNTSIIIAMEELNDKLDLESWLENSTFDLSDYQKENIVFRFSTTTPQTVSYTKTLDETEEKINFIKNNNLILIIKSSVLKEATEQKKIVGEIIKTIKLN
jgi:hypothetical protein